MLLPGSVENGFSDWGWLTQELGPAHRVGGWATRGGAQEFAFLQFSQVAVPWLVWEPHFENHCPKEKGSWVTRGRHLRLTGDEGRQGKWGVPAGVRPQLHSPLICAGRSGHLGPAMMNSAHLSRGRAVWKAPPYRSIGFLLTVLLSQFPNQSNSVALRRLTGVWGPGLLL